MPRGSRGPRGPRAKPGEGEGRTDKPIRRRGARSLRASDSASSPPPSLLPHSHSPSGIGMSSSCLASPAGAAICRPRRPRRRVACSAVDASGSGSAGPAAWFVAGGKGAGRLACGVLAAWAVASASNPVIAASQRLPPLSTEPNRCERAFVGNTIGQANGVYDKPLDLRFCDYTNEKTNLKGKSLAAALMSDAKFDGADMSEVVMSKAYAVGASFKGTDFTNAVIDRVNFEKADLTGAIFKNTVLSGSTFNDAKMEDVVFEDTIIGYIDLQKLCTNTSISADGKLELGCR
ncbi:hypothetical protein BS78_01G185700 [Paspalum vaginatum]|nr:hypothetical protein BS78_01G185700 [Paspalum vaginatum]